MNRRTLLLSAAGTTALLAGCVGTLEDDSDEGDDARDNPDDSDDADDSDGADDSDDADDDSGETADGSDEADDDGPSDAPDDSDEDDDPDDLLSADGISLGIDGTDIVVEEMGDAEIIEAKAGGRTIAEIEDPDGSLSLNAGLYDIVADTDADSMLSGEVTLGKIQVGDVAFTLDTWEEATLDAENGVVEDEVLRQEAADEPMTATATFELDDRIGSMVVYPEYALMDSEAEVVLDQPGYSYGFFVQPDASGGQTRGLSQDFFDPAEPYVLTVDSDPTGISDPSDGIVALDRVDFYVGSEITVLG